jgi:DNA-binding transcriptional LysR family regulator
MPLRFTLRQLEYLVAVGDAGSVSGAARRVNVSSPSISVAIAQLEAEFGLPLFVRRHAQGLSLTQSGRQFTEQARAVLAAAGQLNDLANTVTGQVRGPLAVGCLLTFAQMSLPALRRSFTDRFPQVEFRQYERNQAELFDGLRRAELDVALTYDLDLPYDLGFSPLAALPPLAVLAADHPLAGQAEVAADQLAAYPMVLLDLPHSADYLLSFFTALGLRPNIVERTGDMAVMRSLVANGVGYSIANIRSPSPLSPDGKPVVTVPLSGEVRPMILGLALAEGAANALTVRRFVEHCREAVGRGEVPGVPQSLALDAGKGP